VLRALVIYVGISIAFLIAYAAARPRIRLHRHRARLRAMTPDELATEAREYAKWAGYDRTFGDSAIFRQARDWSQRSLARAIEDLYSRAAAQDLQEGNRVGPGSQVYFFYDCGLAWVLETLEKRSSA